MKTLNTYISIIILMLIMSSCNNNPTPKPQAYLRIDIPKHGFTTFNNNFPFSFEYADYAVINNANNPQHPYWMYIDYKKFKARIYISYNDVSKNILPMLEDAHNLAYKHMVVATDIQQELIIHPENKVYGLYYKILGDKVASPINFYLTDSIQHFVRGALYFNMEPKNDSLAPVIQSINQDINHLISTFKWKNVK